MFIRGPKRMTTYLVDEELNAVIVEEFKKGRRTGRRRSRQNG
jgi:hypothetical protein